MMDVLITNRGLWQVVTHLGSASLLLPALVVAGAGLWQAGQGVAVHRWLVALTLAVAATLFSKVIFCGWGIGSAVLDFTGISGHSLLAASILPVLFGWLLADARGNPSVGAVLGLLLSVAVAVSRVVLGAHSVSEVVFGGLLGALVSGVALCAMRCTQRRAWAATVAVVVILSAFGTTVSNYLPTHNWEVSLALKLSGRHRPFTRHELLRRIAPNPGNASGSVSLS